MNSIAKVLSAEHLEDLREKHKSATEWLQRCDEEKELFMRNFLGPDYDEEIAEKGFEAAFEELKRDVQDIKKRSEAEMRLIPMLRGGYIKVPHSGLLGVFEFEDIIDDEVAENTI